MNYFNYCSPQDQSMVDLMQYLGLPTNKNFSKLKLEIDANIPEFVKLHMTKFDEISGGNEIEYTDEEYYLKYNKTTSEFICELI